jgi:hypothetical protein
MNQWVNPNNISQPIHIKVTPHRSLNSSKGVIRCRDLRDCSDEEVLDALRPEGVTHVKHIMTKRETSVLPTNTFILTFGKPTPPKYIKAAYLNIPVEPFIPNPLRCFNCQKFGHGKSTCTRKSICARCSKEGHLDNACTEDLPHCANCSGSHPSYSKECPEWTKQQAIVKIKNERNISFEEAKNIYSNSAQSARTSRESSTSYASAIKSTHNISTQTDLTWPLSNNSPVYITSEKHSTESQTSTKAMNEPDDSSDEGAAGGAAKSNIPRYSSTPKIKIQLNSRPGPASSKPGFGSKPSKGSNDQIKLYNKFGSLDCMDLEVTHSPTKGPGSRKKS